MCARACMLIATRCHRRSSEHACATCMPRESESGVGREMGQAFDYTYYNTYTSVVGAFTGWIGIVIFQSFMSGWTFRNLFWVTTLMQVVASAFDLLIIVSIQMSLTGATLCCAGDISIALSRYGGTLLLLASCSRRPRVLLPYVCHASSSPRVGRRLFFVADLCCCALLCAESLQHCVGDPRQVVLHVWRRGHRAGCDDVRLHACCGPHVKARAERPRVDHVRPASRLVPVTKNKGECATSVCSAAGLGFLIRCLFARATRRLSKLWGGRFESVGDLCH